MTAARCPFARCLADVELLDLRTDVGTDKTKLFVPTHDVQPASWYGQCPASLMHFVLTPSEQESLIEQAGVYDRVLASRRRDRPAVEGPVAEAPTPGLNASGSPGSDRWFRPSGPSSPRHHPPLAGHPKIEPVPAPVAPGGSGGSMASVAESRAAGEAVNAEIAEAMRLAIVAADKFQQAANMQRAFAGSVGHASLLEASTDLTNAEASCGDACQFGAQAVDRNESYLVTL